MSSTYTEEDLRNLRWAFDMFDRDGDGKMVAEEEYVQIVLEAISLKPTPEDLKEIIETLDKKKTGYIEWDDFIKVVQQRTRKHYEDGDIRRAFEFLDADKKGYVTLADLCGATKRLQLASRPGEGKLEKMLKSSSSDGVKLTFADIQELFFRPSLIDEMYGEGPADAPHPVDDKNLIVTEL